MRLRGRTFFALLALVLVAVAAAGGARLLGGATTPTALGPAHFVEATATAGINHAYTGDFPYFVGGGVAAFDCDGDGRPELYFAGGADRAALFHNDTVGGGPLRFTQLADPATDLTAVVGAYPLDVDGDGRTDLAVLRLGPDVMLRGLGGCRFEPANEAWGIRPGQDWTAAFSAKWEGQARLPTLAFGNYLGLAASGDPGDTCADSVLLRPAADGAAYSPPVPLSPGYCTLSVLFSDWDRSGRGDLRMTNDRHYSRDGSEQLWRVAAGEPPRLYGAADGWQTMRIWGMGIASQDLTGDGLPEVYLTSQGDNKLQTLSDGSGQPRYVDIALRRGATAHRPFAGDTKLPSTAWHDEFADVNNDSFMDLFVAKGNVEAMPDYAARDPSNLLLGQADGTFTESAEAAGIVSYARARGAALVDLDLDGLLDLVVVNRRENVNVWRNVGSGATDAVTAAATPMGHWLALRLEQAAPNTDAIGAWIEVRTGDRTVQRELTVGGGHAGGQLGWIHFGLGAAERAAVRVQWPGGERGPWMTIGADGFAIIERGAAEARPWRPQP